MIQIEPFSCNSKKELETRERYWIETLKSKLNCVIPTRTQREYYDNNKEKIAEREKKYREQNKEKIAGKVNCDNCGCNVSKKGLTRHKKSKKCINFQK